MKLVFVSNFAPATNYTRDLSIYFNKVLSKDDSLYLCGRRDEIISDNNNPQVDKVWERKNSFFLDILEYVWKVNPDVVHFQQEIKMYGPLSTALLLPWLILILRLKRVGVVTTIHAVVAPEQIDKNFLENFNVHYSPLKMIATKLFFKYIYITLGSFSNKITVHTDSLKKILVESYGMSSKKVIVIEHGIREIKDLREKPTSAAILKKFALLKGKKIILVFGYFSPRKGYEFLIDAFSEALGKVRDNKWALALVGDVTKEFLPYKLKIEALIKAKKLERNVLIAGYADDQMVDEFYRLAKVVLIPAIISFNTSGSLSLALAYQKPLLVADVKPLSMEVKQNNFGLLYDGSNVKSCAKELVTLMSDENAYGILSEKLARSVKRRYWTNIAKQHYDLYKSLF